MTVERDSNREGDERPQEQFDQGDGRMQIPDGHVRSVLYSDDDQIGDLIWL